MRSRLALALFAVLAALFAAASPGVAQDDAAGASFITPFPPGDVYNLVMIGDDLAEGLLAGAVEIFQKDPRVVIRNGHLSVNGLMRNDFDQKLVELEENLKSAPAQIAIVMMGAWDRVSVRDPKTGKRAMVGTEGWRREYAARSDRLLKLLKRRNITVYWVGLPAVRRYDANDDVQLMNSILRERVYLNGAKYIDSYAGFADETGGYSAYGPDLTGKIRLLRSGDGVYFTWEGNRKLAYFVDRELRRDLTQARTDRAIPLDGDETEQSKINPETVKLPDSAAAQGKGGAGEGAQSAPTKAQKQAEAGGVNDQKADNGKINLRIVSEGGREETVALDIVRPAIPASVVALVTRRESPDRLSQLGESIIDQISGGLTVMSTVALSTGTGQGAGRRRLSPSQAPYFRVLFKGERLPPKPGRADDTSWPRPPPPPEAAYIPEHDPVETGTTSAATDATGKGKERRRSRE